MKINLSDKIIAWLALLSGLTISAVAIWYSVAGLVSIFAAAVIPIIVMGVVLEVSKLIATVWLKINWNRAPIFIRTYLLVAIIILMVITSMGIFGFLSKAHSDAGLVSGDVQAKIAVYDEKIKTERENIDAARKALTQMDAQVNERLSRSTDDRGAERAVQIRRQQQAERTRLQNDISRSQGAIAKLNDERAPIAAEVRKVEAEVGPIKYIANFIYGDNPDTNILEKAVTWVIIIIVIVFDPLAVILLLASQYSFQWFRQAREEQDVEGDSPRETNDVVDTEPPIVTEQSPPWPFIVDEELKTSDDPHPPGWMFKNEHIVTDTILEIEEDTVVNEADDTEILNSVSHSEKAAMAAWKHDHPNSSLKLQRRLFEKGLITQLPWTEYVHQSQAAEEAQKWAEENAHTEEGRAAQEWASENSDRAEIVWMETDGQGNQIKKTKDTYEQNAEQSDRTLWQRIQDAKK